MHSDTFRKISDERREIHGIMERVETYRHGGDTFEVQVDETDRVVCLTTEPKKYLDTKLTIPIGKRDDQGNPVYKVVELKAEFIVKK